MIKPIGIQENTLLAPYTSYAIGGKARYFASPASLNEIKETLSFAKQEQLSLFILGKGSNILVSDHGFDGLILDTSNLTTLSIKKNRITVGAGVMLTKLVMLAVKNNLGGLEELAGIPGSVGGGILMNAGAYGRELSENLLSVTWIDTITQEVKTSPKEELAFSYRTSAFKHGNKLILEATFELPTVPKETLLPIVKDIQAKRKAKQPLSYPSCGSVFKRPKGNYAGALIEEAKLKGVTIGGAQISELHANFFINKKDATAQNVLDLISLATQKVFERSGIILESEVILVGNFTTPLWTPTIFNK